MVRKEMVRNENKMMVIFILTWPPFALNSATKGDVNSSNMVSLTSAFSSLKPMRL